MIITPSLCPLVPPLASLQVDFKHEGEWPTYGNDDDRVVSGAVGWAACQGVGMPG